MTSVVASKGAPLAGLLRKLLAAPSGSGAPGVAYVHCPARVASSRRLFNSWGSPLGLGRYDDEVEEVSSGSEDDDAVDDRRHARDFSGPVFFSSAGTRWRPSSPRLSLLCSRGAEY
jgi:hypothetical protein